MKKANTLVQQAIDAVPSFVQSYEKFRNIMLAEGKSVKSIENYGRKIATVVLRFGILPKMLTTDQVNTHLAEMRSNGRDGGISGTLYRTLLNNIRLIIGQRIVEIVSRKKRREAVQQRLGYCPCRCSECGGDTRAKIIPICRILVYGFCFGRRRNRMKTAGGERIKLTNFNKGNTKISLIPINK